MVRGLSSPTGLGPELWDQGGLAGVTASVQVGPAPVHPQPLFQEKAAGGGGGGQESFQGKTHPSMEQAASRHFTPPPHPTPSWNQLHSFPLPFWQEEPSSWKNRAVLPTPTSAELNPWWPCRGGRVCACECVCECVCAHTCIQVLPGHHRLQPWVWERQGASEGKEQPEPSTWSLSFVV